MLVYFVGLKPACHALSKLKPSGSALVPSRSVMPRPAPRPSRAPLVGRPPPTGRAPRPPSLLTLLRGRVGSQINTAVSILKPQPTLRLLQGFGWFTPSRAAPPQSKRLEGEAVLGSWGVEKDSLIEVKTRSRGGMHGGGGGEGGADGGGGVEGREGGTDSCPGGVGGVDGVGGVGSGSSSGVGGGGAGGVGSGSCVGGADSGLGVASGGVVGCGDAEGVGAGQDGKRPQNPEGKPLSPSKVDAEKQWLQSAKATAELEPEANHNALDDIVAVTASTARSGVEVQAEWLELKERGIADGAAAAR